MTPERRARRLSALSSAAGVLSVALGVAVLDGVWLDIDSLVQPVPFLPGMVPNTASWFILLGASLLLQRREHVSRPWRWLAQVCAIAVILHAGTTLLEHALRTDAGIDQLIVQVLDDLGTGFPVGRSAPFVAAAFLMLGMALSALDMKFVLRSKLAEIFASGAILIALLALAGYVYGATALYASGDLPHTGIAPHTLLGIVLLAAGTLAVRPHRALMGLLTSPSAGGFVVRRLLIGTLAIPTLGLFVTFGHGASLYGQPFAEALLVVIGFAVAIALVLTTGRALDRIDAARTASERAVAEREERLRDLIDQASDGVFIANLAGRYLEVNDAGCEMLGYRRDEIVGKSVREMLPDADIPRLEAARTLLLRGGAQVDEWAMRRSDGTFLPVEVSTKFLPDGRWQSLVRDISTRKDVERASQAVAEAVTKTPHSNVHTVLETIARGARSVANAGFAAVGLDIDISHPSEPWAIAGLSAKDAARLAGPPPADLLTLPAAEDRTIRTADVQRDPVFCGRAPHHPAMASFLGVPIRARGRVIGGLCLVNKQGAADFTVEDKHAIEQLAARAGTTIEIARLYQSEALERAWLQATIDHMPEGVILTDATGLAQVENKSIQAFAHDKGAMDLSGQAARYDLRFPNGEPVPPDERPLVRALMDGVTVQREFLLRHADGRLVPMLVSAAPVFDEAGHRSGAVTVHQDISTLKELEQLREEWSSIVAHDLRQPAGVITLSADILARTLDPQHGEEALKVVHHIRESAKRLKQMIGDLLDMSRIEAAHLSLERVDTDLTAWLDETVERLAVLAPDHEVRLQIHIRQAIVSIDPARIEQVLGNLIGNAAKYGDPGAQIAVALDRRDGAFEISVSNRGGGILPSELPNLFQRFQRGGAARHAGIAGLGVGLYICKGLVEAHGGRIWADSEPGETTTFAFTLPATAEALPKRQVEVGSRVGARR